MATDTNIARDIVHIHIYCVYNYYVSLNSYTVVYIIYVGGALSHIHILYNYYVSVNQQPQHTSDSIKLSILVDGYAVVAKFTKCSLFLSRCFCSKCEQSQICSVQLQFHAAVDLYTLVYT